ncbi:hypothetical protein CR513_46347, partial [Mucuna pruriens]
MSCVSSISLRGKSPQQDERRRNVGEHNKDKGNIKNRDRSQSGQVTPPQGNYHHDCRSRSNGEDVKSR